MGYTLLSEIKRKARKEHRCIWCGQKIEIREFYIAEASIYYNDFQYMKWHQECKAACAIELAETKEEDFDPYSNERPAK